LGALLVSLFNVKWRWYVWGGDVEELKFCLFSVVFPVRCISSVSPRFYIRRHSFCFLPLAAILESLLHRQFKKNIQTIYSSYLFDIDRSIHSVMRPLGGVEFVNE
jgi:hypothetical protein